MNRQLCKNIIMNRMKLLGGIAALSLCLSASAQQMNQQLDRSNPDLVRNTRTGTRHEIIIPDVDGFKVVKTDLHAHTVYSDAETSPEFRVREAWHDGLDAIAISDHIEYRPSEGKFSAFMRSDKPESVDLNHSVNLARRSAGQYGITLIPGTEITRSPREIGHFNALFTTDNNTIPDPDPLVAIRNAKRQGAIVQSNHPGWARNDANLTETTVKAIKAGLLDGMECYNDSEFYQKSIEDAINNDLYVCANTDIHGTTAFEFTDYGVFRNMTFVMAKDASAESIKEALLAKRTLAYGFGDICGRQELLEKFFLASMEFRTISVSDNGSRSILMTNKSSLPYYLIADYMVTGIKIEGLCSVIIHAAADEDPSFTVMNMWYGIGKHPVVTVKGIK